MKHLQEALRKLLETVESTVAAVHRDDKTPLPNSLAFQESLSKAERNPQEAYVLVFGDLNGFKSINDQYGHDAGDAVITQAGRILQALFVEGLGVEAFRVSGDEFFLILPKRKLQHFQQMARTFAQTTAIYKDKTIPFKMSFGFASSDESDPEKPASLPSSQELKDRAENALQEAKKQGPGECVGWSPALQAQRLESIRQRCSQCHTTIACSVPFSRLPPQRKLKRCPVCEHSFE